MTDMYRGYNGIGKDFASHGRVNHGIKQWKSGNAPANTIEGFSSIFKRGMKGVYQRCSEEHLNRYLAEFDFRYNTRTALEIDDKELPDRPPRYRWKASHLSETP